MITIYLAACRGTHLTDDERFAGQAAAREVFESRGIDPLAAANAYNAKADGQPYDAAAADAFEDAEIAATNAACAGWKGIAEDLVLEINE